MEIIKNVIEYYDELYPVTDIQKSFYTDLMKKYTLPIKFIRVGCGTGYFEHLLAREGHDVTGIDTSKELLESANLKRRNQLMSIRFFLMSSIEMTRFLGKNFYNIISCLNDKIIFIHDRTLMRKFFFDCKQLLAENGTLVIQVYNFKNINSNTNKVSLPVHESIRSKLYSELITDSDGTKYITQNVETGTGKILPVMERTSVYPITAEEIVEFAKEAGFNKVNLYADYSKTPFTGTEHEIIAEIG